VRFFDRLERAVTVPFDVECHVSGSPRDPVDARLDDVARVERAAERFDLKTQKGVAVPPLRVFQTIGRRLFSKSNSPPQLRFPSGG
jgi:hypothetical protein